MKRIPDYTEEREQIVKEMGYYIPLPRLSAMSKTASKIVKLVTVNDEYTPSYADAKIVLKMAMEQLDMVTKNDQE